MDLKIFNETSLFKAATNLFEQLGIKLNSNTAEALPTKDLLKNFYKDNEAFNSIKSTYFIGIIVDSVFQETGMSDVNYSIKEALQEGDINYNGLMLFALELSKKPTRTEISEITRAFNRISQKMPVALVLKYTIENEAVISIATSERFKYLQNWRQGEKAGKVIILRDIHTQNTHTGHLRILQDLKIRTGVTNYAQLHAQWIEVLDVNILNKKFFQELANWYFWAMDKVQFPDDIEKNKDVRNATNLIRLITRVIFIWFIKEKHLVPASLFNEKFLSTILKDFQKNKNSSNYYQAILQNLFFGTLNQKMDERDFAEDHNRTNKLDQGIKNKYRYPDKFNITKKEVIDLFKDIPFLNGGLFDCLDKFDEEKLEKGKKEQIFVDGFTRLESKQAIVPDYLFFGEETEVDLNETYGTRGKRYVTKGLIGILNSYKFTVAENTPIEEEIALDPELLGKVFENLLASYNPETKTTARKQTGSFYTPREIVNYMVDESLIEYLKSVVSIPAHEKENSVSIPAHEKESVVSIPAHENESVSIPAHEKESSVRIPAHEKESSVRIPAHEKENSVRIPAHEKENSVSIPAHEKESVSIPAHENESVVSIPAHEKESVVRIPAHENESVSIPAHENENSVSIPAHENESVSIPAHEKESSVRIPAHELNQKQDAFETFFNPNNEIQIHQGNLPHWQQESVWYFVTFRLADSIPAEVAEQIKVEREIWLKNNKKNEKGEYTKEQIKEYYRLFSDRIESLLNNGKGSCILKNPEISKIVADALNHFNNQRYVLDEWVIMPNHVHILFKPLGENTLPDILHTWKSYTANEINKITRNKGQLWMHESYDHIVRNEKAFEAIRNYIRQNPVKANLKAGVYVLSSGSKDASETFRHASDTFEARLRKLFSYNDEGNPFNPEETDKLIEAINNAKILDPACGSGAFPMGVLHKMVYILQKLDPGNVKWKAQQKEKIIGNQIKELEKDKKAIEGLSDKAVREKAIQAVDERLKEIDEIFESKNYFDDYARKLYLIENCIYGIDIQPIAIQISKLRFFISLIIDQNVRPSSLMDDSKKPENMGVRPLPNLETKFVAANTLISLEIPTTDLFSENNPIKLLQEQLKATRHEYFNAKTRKEKLQLQQQDKELRKKIAAQISDTLINKQEEEIKNLEKQLSEAKKKLVQIEAAPEQKETIESTNIFGKTKTTVIDKKKEKIKAQKSTIANIEKQINLLKAANNKDAIQKVAQKISSFDPYDQNHFANWFEPEWMFGNDVKDGFDIVIGNPPYVQLQKEGGKLAKQFENQHYQTFERTGDIYSLFYEKGIQLLTQGGHLTYITSNKWMRAGYGEKLRKFFLKYNPLLLIDLGPGVFENATVDTNILVLQKSKTNNINLKAVTLQTEKGNINIQKQVNERAVVLEKLTSDAWFIGNVAEQRLKEKIERIGKPLKDWDVNIYYGIKTGLNEAFIITTEKRNEILANCKDEDERKRTEAIIKPILRGRDIKRYYYEWAGLWVIGTFPALRLNIDEFPTLKKFFLDNFDIRKLEQTGKKYPEFGFDARKKTGNKWFETQDQIAYYPEFEKEKVVWGNISYDSEFCFVDKGIFINAPANLITSEKTSIKYIVAIMNAKIFDWQFKQVGIFLGHAYEWKKQYVEQVKIPPITPENQPIVSQIEALADKILAAKKENPQADTSQWEREIDGLVYQLYELTEEEITIIENSFKNE